MGVSGWMRVGGLLAVAGLLLSGCASAAAPPLSAAERATIRTALTDATWAAVAEQYPEAIRPSVAIAGTVPDRDWPDAMVGCLRSTGIVARISEGQVLYNSNAGQTPVDVAVSFYACEASHPSESQVATFLTPAQQIALHRYFANVVRPCLLGAGAPSPAVPTREFGRRSTGWNPYDTIWETAITRASLHYLEGRCPPLPDWLDLGEST